MTLLLSGLRLLVNIRFQVLFHSPPGVLFTFPSWYYALSVDICVLPWRVVPPASHGVSRVPRYSGTVCSASSFAYMAFTSCGAPSQKLQLERFRFLPVVNPGGPKSPGLGSALFARRYLGYHYYFLFLRLLRCFSSAGSPPFSRISRLQRDGLPHIVTGKQIGRAHV